MPASKYKHVTKRTHRYVTNDRIDKPWQAQVKGEYLGCFMKEVQAAEAVAKKLGQPKVSFLRPAAASKASKAPKRTHRYVYWHSARHAWQVKIGTEFFGLYPNHEDALAAVVMQTGLQKDDLLLSPDHVRRSLQGQRNSVQMHIAWFQHLYMAYSKPEGVAYPGDLDDMGQRASQGSRILQHPNFIVPMLLAKFGPHRDALHDAFLSVPQPMDDPLDLKRTYLVIVAALTAISSIDAGVMDPWMAGPGRNNSHHSGLVVYANVSLKIMAPCDEELQKPNCKKRRTGTTPPQRLVFGKKPRAFLIKPYSMVLEKILLKVRTFGLALLKIKAPKSLKDWKSGMSAMTSVVKNAPGIPNTMCYRYKWVVRGYWDYLRRSVGMAPGISWTKHAKVLSHPKTFRAKQKFFSNEFRM